MINVDGSINWKYDLPDGWYYYSIFSTKDNKIILYVEDFTKGLERFILHGFDEKGNLLWKPKEYKGRNNLLLHLTVSKDNNYLTGFTSWDHLWIMDINNGEFLWKYPLKGERPDTLQISSDGKYILLGETTLLRGEKLGKPTLIDAKNGKALRQFEREESGEFFGTNKILRRTSNKIEIFSISEILKEED